MFILPGFLKSTTGLMLTLAALSMPIGAHASDLDDTGPACALPEYNPNFDLDSTADDGFGLGAILEHERTTSKGYIQTIEPRLSIDWGSDEQITNLSQVPAGQKKLVFGDSTKGYQVIDFNEKGFSVGISGTMEFPNTTALGSAVWASVGLMPINTSHSMAIRYMRNAAAVENRSPAPKLEHALAAFNKLTVNDVLSYNTSGGIVFWGGFGASMIGAQVAVMARGDFQIYIEKIDQDHAYVKLSESELRSLGLQVGALLSNISTTKYSQYGKAFGFMLNLRDPMGVRAFKDLVRGNIAPIQKLASRPGSTAVQFWDETRNHRVGHSTYSKIFGIPFLLKLTWSRDRFFEAVRKKMYQCDRTLEAVYGAYFTNKTFKILGYREEKSKSFYGTSYALRNNTGKSLARGFFGEMQMGYHGNDTTVISLRRAMKRLGEDTGLGDLLMLNMPARSDKMAHTSISLKARFSAQNTQNILRRASKAMGATLKAASGLMVAKTFEQGGDFTAGICSSPEIAPEGTTIDTAQCLELVAGRTDRAVEKMTDAAINLRRALSKKDEKAATKAYARFGEAMLTNQFTFQSGLMLAGDGLKVDYIVEGSDFAGYTATFRTNGASGKLVRDQRAPLLRRKSGAGTIVQPAMTLSAAQ